jgi:GT2 family glycosyltransferase
MVNYNAGARLSECVRSALKQTQEVIVVDNNSSDQSLKILATDCSNEPRLIVHRCNQNRGFAAGCNQGIKLATQPVLLFLNPDCILGTQCVTRLIEALFREPAVGMVGGQITNPNGTEQAGGRRALPTSWRCFVRAFGLYRLARFWPSLFLIFISTVSLCLSSRLRLKQYLVRLCWFAARRLTR